MAETLRTFPDPLKPKSFYLDRVRRHRQADELIKGLTWDGQRGCAIGCTLETYQPQRYPELLGVPEVMAHLEDRLFESLPTGHLEWPERFLTAIPEGADLSGVFSAWCVRLLDRCLERLGQADHEWHRACREAVTAVRDLHRDHPRRFDETDPEHDWMRVQRAANTAARLADDADSDCGEIWKECVAEWSARTAEASAFSIPDAATFSTQPAAETAWSAGIANWSRDEAEASKRAEILKQAEDLLELLAVPETNGSWAGAHDDYPGDENDH